MTRTWPEIARRADGVTVETPEGYYTAEVTYPSHYMESSLVTVRTMPWQEHEESLACALAEVATLRAQLASAKAASRSLLERVALASGLTDAVGCDEETVLAALQVTWLRAGELAAENERLREEARRIVICCYCGDGLAGLDMGKPEEVRAAMVAHDMDCKSNPLRAKAAMFDEWRAADAELRAANQEYDDTDGACGVAERCEAAYTIKRCVERRMREWTKGEASHG